MKCSFLITDDESLKETFHWLHSVGICWVKTPEDVHDFGSIDVELNNTLSILEIFSQLDVLNNCRITSQGVSFYVIDIPLGSFKAFQEGTTPAITGESADGVIFCPMSNVKAIDTFGSLQANKDKSTQIGKRSECSYAG
ncbi:MAG TPA: hypothetical protein IGS17_18455 [Oscillatoriales cyanobacterium M59_W2019_021]|nr:hypothetical protein [Oscillatoriales cyanobacterium M4454_W2019_049]HIK52884.1 hypothetical protein [Oscillatoriales cyanobacterium M59_W2019_021]